MRRVTITIPITLGLGLLSLAYGGEPEVVSAVPGEAPSPLPGIGLVPPAQFAGTAEALQSYTGRNVRVRIDPESATPEAVAAAWREAALAQGWNGSKYEIDVHFGNFWKLGKRLHFEARREGTGLIVDLVERDVAFTDPAWPTDPFCPPGSRPDPADKYVRRCFRDGTNRTRTGRYERVNAAGEVVERGQFGDDGNPAGDWVEAWDDATGVRYEVTTTRGLRDEVVVYRRSGEVVLRVDATGWTWADGTVIRRVDGHVDSAVLVNVEAVGFEADTIEVLDVDPPSGRVAFRLKLRYAGVDKAVDCHYAGLDPGVKGVVLGLWERGAVRTWDVYAAVVDARECTTNEDATRNLAEAKAAFAAVGLDPKRLPAASKAGEMVVEERERPAVTDHPWFTVPGAGIAGRIDGVAPPLVILEGTLGTIGVWERDGAGIVLWTAGRTYRGPYFGFVATE